MELDKLFGLLYAAQEVDLGYKLAAQEVSYQATPICVRSAQAYTKSRRGTRSFPAQPNSPPLCPHPQHARLGRRSGGVERAAPGGTCASGFGSGFAWSKSARHGTAAHFSRAVRAKMAPPLGRCLLASRRCIGRAKPRVPELICRLRPTSPQLHGTVVIRNTPSPHGKKSTPCSTLAWCTVHLAPASPTRAAPLELGVGPCRHGHE